MADSEKPVYTHLETGDEHCYGFNLDTGMPGVGLFANAVSVWAWGQARPVTINDAALAFNVAPDLVRQAVEHNHWMFIGAGDIIEHEGE